MAFSVTCLYYTKITQNNDDDGSNVQCTAIAIINWISMNAQFQFPARSTRGNSIQSECGSACDDGKQSAIEWNWYLTFIIWYHGMWYLILLSMLKLLSGDIESLLCAFWSQLLIPVICHPSTISLECVKIYRHDIWHWKLIAIVSSHFEICSQVFGEMKIRKKYACLCHKTMFFVRTPLEVRSKLYWRTHTKSEIACVRWRKKSHQNCSLNASSKKNSS